MVLDSAAATNVVSAAMNGRGKVSEFSASEKEPMTDTDRERTDGERATANKSSIVKLYIMKMARPRGGEENGTLKKLHGEFTAIQAEIKGIQTRLNDKREVVKELRKSMSQAKALRDCSQPEFEEKLGRIKELRDLRKSYLDKVAAIKESMKGLDCKTEAELDAKIKAQENLISGGGISIREEKMVVSEISKLRAQREKIKGFEGYKETMAEAESEASKIKSIIDEMDGDFSIIKGEREAATKILSDFYNQLKAAEKEAEKVDEEYKDAVDRKNEAWETLEAARREAEGSSTDFRDNRKFSLLVRDLVAAGQVEEAKEACRKQVQEGISRFSSDPAFRQEYCKAWAEQRRSAVSVLLPDSGPAIVSAAPSTSAAKGGPAGKAAPKAAPVKPVARGAEKARDLIASLMQQASEEAVARSRAVGGDSGAEADDEPEDDGPNPHLDDPPQILRAAPTPAAAPAAASALASKVPAKQVENPAAKAAEVFNFKVDLPQIDDSAFVPPSVTSNSTTLTKDQIRELERLKAQEAELRKKRRLEANDKKRVKAAEMSKRNEEEEKQGAAAKAKQAKAAAGAPLEDPAANAENPAAAATEEGDGGHVSAPVKASAGSAGPSYVPPAVKPVAAAKRPAAKYGPLKRVARLVAANQALFVVLAFLLLMVALFVFASF